MKTLALFGLSALVGSAHAGCKLGTEAAPEPSAHVTTAAPSTADAGMRRALRVVEAPPSGSVEAAVREARESASGDDRTVVVYVGAVWCEPCQRFHRAAARGELDSAFPNITLLEFDLDRDRERLASAGYVSDYIPLFALPGADGLASGKRIEGGIKGEGAVGYIVPRLKEMLAEK